MTSEICKICGLPVPEGAVHPHVVSDLSMSIPITLNDKPVKSNTIEMSDDVIDRIAMRVNSKSLVLNDALLLELRELKKVWENNCSELEEQNAKLKEALEFYANENSWHPHVCDSWSGLRTAFGADEDPDDDIEVINNNFIGGKLARQVLKQLFGKTESLKTNE